MSPPASVNSPAFRAPDGIQTKLDRAEAHIAELEMKIQELLALESLQFTFEPDDDRERWRYNVSGVPEIPLEWSAIVGDVLFNLRSALDHLADLLVRSCGRRPTKRTSFPILAKPRSDGTGARLPLDIPPGTSPDIRERLEVVQPYTRGLPPNTRTEAEATRDPLKVLSNLNNLDKHRALLVAVMVLDVMEMWWTSDDEEEPGKLIAANVEPLSNGDPVATFQFSGGRPPAGFNAHPTVAVFLNEDPKDILRSTAVVPLLRAFRGRVTTTVFEFAQFL